MVLVEPLSGAHGYYLMGAITVWIVLLEHVLPLSDFAARKLCHAGCGLGIMTLKTVLDSTTAPARYFVWLLSAASIAMVWGMSPLPRFRFSSPRDIGITAYLLLVSAWFALELPATLLAPLFFADPAGAVVGKWASRNFPGRNRAWYANKTYSGSLAVFVVTCATVAFPCTLVVRLGVGLLATIAEALGGDYDNLALAFVVLTASRVAAS